jgi:nucleotide-binding universal stress UspA family protein
MKVLIAIDDSPCSAEAIDNVADQKWNVGTEFRVISVTEPLYSENVMVGMCVPSFEELQSEYHSQLVKLVDAKVEQIRQCQPNHIVDGMVVSGAIAETILKHAEEWPADLIVLGSHGRRGIEKFWLGSVAERVAGLAHCSVEVVRSKKSAAVVAK